MKKHLLTSVQVVNRERDKAWERLINYKDVRVYFNGVEGNTKFPVGGGYLDLWCAAWDAAWEIGFSQGYAARGTDKDAAKAQAKGDARVRDIKKKDHVR